MEASAAESAAADVTPANENPTTSSTEDVSAASTQPAKTPDLHTAEHLASAVQKKLNVISTNGGANEHSRDDLVNFLLNFIVPSNSPLIAYQTLDCDSKTGKRF